MVFYYLTKFPSHGVNEKQISTQQAPLKILGNCIIHPKLYHKIPTVVHL